MLDVGDLLVPRETPHGPDVAREAWADALGQLLVVVKVLDEGRVLQVNCPTDGATYQRLASDVEAEYVRSGAVLSPPSWGEFLTRAATEAARVDRGEFGENVLGYWMAVARAVTKVEVESFKARAAQLGDGS